ncbi:hypothetical protein D1O33_24950 (plasmid) [Rhodococcus rhodochrous]|uniref:hypothetical protein n=1 Tax=Rhodococcus rhodochrous TaxID=1829 RepID=UPI00132F0429|nr:hypothetical protein [Rhodococcus rhodochrous]QHG85295.1 hypothetical protein D1O33_24950 [Rhodococcus rhodochrous]
MNRCTRFHRDGTACTNSTEHVDGWCRQDGCPGFVRRDPATAPPSSGAPRGTELHIRTSPATGTGLDLDELFDIRITMRAVDSFRFHHGGDQRSAEAQMRNMLEDFLLKSSSTVSASGYVRLSRQGYSLILSPDRTAVTGYFTVHRERTWEQVKNKVPSRFHRAPTHTSVHAPEARPPVPVEQFAEVFDAATVHLTGRVQRSYARLAGMVEASDLELHTAIRADAAQLPTGTLVQRPDGLFEIEHAARIWLISPDCCKLIGVKAHQRPQPVELDGPSA